MRTVVVLAGRMPARLQENAARVSPSLRRALLACSARAAPVAGSGAGPWPAPAAALSCRSRDPLCFQKPLVGAFGGFWKHGSAAGAELNLNADGCQAAST